MTVGTALVLDEPISMWGGVDVHTGRICEQGHPQHGESLQGKILVMPHGRGSSSSSSVLAELLRTGLGPVGIVLRTQDSILHIGALVAEELYHVSCPVVVSTLDIDGGGVWEIDDGMLRRVEK